MAVVLSNIGIDKQLEAFTKGSTKEGIARMDKSYIPGLGAALLKGAPESFQKIQLSLENEHAKRHNREVSDQERFKMQLNLMKQIHEHIQERKAEQLDREQRLVKAFQKLVIKEPKLSEENKLFADIEGSSIQKHLTKTDELRNKVVAFQQVLGKTNLEDLSEQSRANLVKDITSLHKQSNTLASEEKDLKPDQGSVNKAFIKGAKMGSDRYLQNLQGMGFKPGEGIHGELSSEMGKGVAGTDTVRSGKQMGLGEKIVKTLAETARYLFTPTEKYQALTDKSIVGADTILQTKNDHAISTNEMLQNSKQISFANDTRSLKEQINNVAARLELKIDWEMGRQEPEMSKEKNQELTY